LGKRALPPNLYERRGYFSWRNPNTREEFGLGRDRASACAQAVEANIHLAKLAHRPRLIDRLTGSADRSVGAWARIYADALAKQDFAENTRRQYASLNRRVVSLLGADTPVRAVTALDVSNAIETVAVGEGKARLAQALRHFMRDWFREAVVRGWRDDNPVRDTKLTVAVEVKRARLSLEVAVAVYERARQVWLKNAIALALVTAQRREDVARAEFSAFHDGGWWCVQESEKATHAHRIFIPLDLKLDAFGMSLGDVLSQCRRTGVLSRHLVHQTERTGNSPVGSRIWIDTISRRFTDTLETLGLDWGEKTPPTFHELRSLSERLYAAQGGVNTQHLLGHNDAATTALYHDSRGSEWIRILDERAR
jgi:enterobacteria phage integrase